MASGAPVAGSQIEFFGYRTIYMERKTPLGRRIDIRTRELDPALWQGDYENDPAFRQTVQSWVNQLWTEKDARIEQLRAERL